MIYVIISNTIELPAKYYDGHQTKIINNFVPGCTLLQQDQYPEDVVFFETLEAAQEEFKKEKYNCKKLAGRVWQEFLLEERDSDGSNYYFHD